MLVQNASKNQNTQCHIPIKNEMLNTYLKSKLLSSHNLGNQRKTKQFYMVTKLDTMT